MTKKNSVKAAFLFVVIGLHLISFAQNQPASTLLNKAQKELIVSTLSQQLLNNYVFPDTALKMSKYLKQRLKSGAYTKITDPVAFSDMLTFDIRSIYHDGHLLVQYNPRFAAQLDNNVPESNSNISTLQRNREANFGFRKVEILNGNIGYINLERFWADPIYGRGVIVSALKFVENTNAIIIDLRANGGGSPETVALICSYFLAVKTHINSSYNRSENFTTEFWAIPDSNFKGVINTPLYILTSNRTFSAAEEFAYNMQSLKRATIIGETTGGGAHNTFERVASNGFVVSIPYGRAINPITHSNWEAVGVKPDMIVSSSQALEKAEMIIFESLISNTKDSSALFDLNWQLDLLKAINNPVTIDSTTLKKYAGVYGDRTFTFENGKLFYQRTSRPKFELEAMSRTMMKGKDNAYFKIEFILNTAGLVNDIKVYYQDNRIEDATRTQK